ncbi:MAG: serine/threonine protein kinase [Labilithrix sp.]|nr:serine/threonine protein kinase [Labilithrix sp.]
MRAAHPATTDSLALSDGRIVTLVEPIGRGSVGEVHRGVVEGAWGVRRPVAVKLYDTSADQDSGDVMRRLGRVARHAAGVRHPAFIQILEVDQTDDYHQPRPFAVMELVTGESLASLLRSWREHGLRVPVDFALVVALKAAEALGAALFSESADGSLTSLLHGDLSPRQILVSDQGEVKVGDFGQGALYDPVSHVRSRSAIAYTAPEVARGLPRDARADVFSLGAMLHEMLVGPRFAAGTGTADALDMVRDAEFHMSLVEPNLPRALRKIVDRAVAANPIQRYAHARALSFDLRREMLRMGLCDAQTSIRQAVVGWCEVRTPTLTSEIASPRRSDVVPKLDAEDTIPEIRRADLK